MEKTCLKVNFIVKDFMSLVKKIDIKIICLHSIKPEIFVKSCLPVYKEKIVIICNFKQKTLILKIYQS